MWPPPQRSWVPVARVVPGTSPQLVAFEAKRSSQQGATLIGEPLTLAGSSQPEPFVLFGIQECATQGRTAAARTWKLKRQKVFSQFLGAWKPKVITFLGPLEVETQRVKRLIRFELSLLSSELQSPEAKMTREIHVRNRGHVLSFSLSLSRAPPAAHR